LFGEANPAVNREIENMSPQAVSSSEPTAADPSADQADTAVTFVPASTFLGRYVIECPIGAGGMGEVYRARDTRLERTVAIKMFPERSARSLGAEPPQHRRPLRHLHRQEH